MSAWRWVAPAPIEAANVIAMAVSPHEGIRPGPFVTHLIRTMVHAPEPDLQRLAWAFPGYASAVVCAKDGDIDKLREAAGGNYVKT